MGTGEALIAGESATADPLSHTLVRRFGDSLRAYSLMVKRVIRIDEVAVRFCLGPHLRSPFYAESFGVHALLRHSYAKASECYE